MRNFQKLSTQAAVAPLMVAIATNPDLWNQHTLRTTHPGTAHSQVDDIWLRFNEISVDNAFHVVNDIQAVDYPALADLPQARDLIFGLMSLVQGEQLGRVIITRMAPGATIAPHRDLGAPATFYERFHIVLQSQPGCIFRAGDEQVQMATGEVWWFDNTQVHEVINNSADDRLTMIVDIRTSLAGRGRA